MTTTKYTASRVQNVIIDLRKSFKDHFGLDPALYTPEIKAFIEYLQKSDIATKHST